MVDDMTSNLVFWGVRGTCPVSGENRNKYGGHTPCSSFVTSEGNLLVFDAGTGIKNLGDWLVKGTGNEPFDLHIFLTHFHLDHIMGLPFFGPLYSPDIRLTFHCDRSPEEMKKNLRGFMGGKYFPIPFEETHSEKLFHHIPEQGFAIDGAGISFCPLDHPQGSVAYKIQDDHNTIVIATDTEHPRQGIDRKLAEFAAEADIFVYDATFTPEEYLSGRMGWGHSTWEEGTKLAKEAGVKNLYLSHLNPDHDDARIDEIVSSAREHFAATFGAKEKGV